MSPSNKRFWLLFTLISLMSFILAVYLDKVIKTQQEQQIKINRIDSILLKYTK